MANKSGSKRQWLIVLVALTDDVMVLALIIFILFIVGVRLPVPALVVLGLAIAAGIYFLHLTIVRALRRRLVTGAEGMIGAFGKAVETLAPTGMVEIKGEYWKAVSTNAKIEAGREIEVTGINGLTLEVKEKSND
jgi:membrane-bound serine protease (ClpP class)